MDDHAALLEAEGALLREAYDLLPRLPFDDLDVLIVDEIGKNVSGSGMDTNVIGRKPGLNTPRIQCIYVDCIVTNAVARNNFQAWRFFNACCNQPFSNSSLRRPRLPRAKNLLR